MKAIGILGDTDNRISLAPRSGGGGWGEGAELRNAVLSVQHITERLSMMLRKVTSINPPLTEKALEDFLGKVPFDLPQSYLDFLRRYNGGRPHPDVFPIDGLPMNPDGAIQVFFGIGTKIPSSDLRNVLMGIPATVPMEVFPIACTDGNDYICFDVRKLGPGGLLGSSRVLGK